MPRIKFIIPLSTPTRTMSLPAFCEAHRNILHQASMMINRIYLHSLYFAQITFQLWSLAILYTRIVLSLPILHTEEFVPHYYRINY